MELAYKHIVICLVDSVERLPIVLDGYELPGVSGSLLLVWYSRVFQGIPGYSSPGLAKKRLLFVLSRPPAFTGFNPLRKYLGKKVNFLGGKFTSEKLT